MHVGPHRSSVVVVGAGVAGLTIARQLAPHRPVTVIESLPVVGGLARSWHYGDFHFDVGPHRFHTENPRVAAFIAGILGEEGLEIPRRSAARMFGGFHEWPLRPSILASMPVSAMVRAAWDLVRREHLPGESFEADIVNKYGRTLYDIFFDPYTRKFLFHSPAELHRDWARAGVNRAVIDQRASADSLLGLLKATLLPAPVDTKFLYAPHGVGRFAERLAHDIEAHGGRILLGCPVRGGAWEDDRIVAVETDQGEVVPCDALIWTAPLPALTGWMGLPTPRLSFLSTIFYNLEVTGPLRHPYQWIYYGGPELFSRISAPTAFAETMAPPGAHGLCCEVTCLEGDDRWKEPDALTDRVMADLVASETIRSAADVQRVHVERVPDTYPIYTLDYHVRLKTTLQALRRYSNLLLAGRSGRFWYNNMDHSIGQGLTMADKILKGDLLAEIDDADERIFWAG